MVCKLHNWVFAAGTKRALCERIRPEQHPFLSSWLQQSWPQIRRGELQHGSWQDVRDAQEALSAAVAELRQHEDVSHLDKFARRIQREPSCDSGCAGAAGVEQQAADRGSGSRVLQGARNNLTGANHRTSAPIAAGVRPHLTQKGRHSARMQTCESV